jgi:hypothetical protein
VQLMGHLRVEQYRLNLIVEVVFGVYLCQLIESYLCCMSYKLRFLFIYTCPRFIHKRQWHLTTRYKINVSSITGVKEAICKFILFVRLMILNITYLNLN